MFKLILPYITAVMTMAAYSCLIVMIKPLTFKYNVSVVMVSYIPVQLMTVIAMLGVTAGAYQLAGKPLVFPHGSEWKLLIILGLGYAVAQSLNTGTYAIGGTVQMMGYMTLLIPIFTSLLNYFLTSDRPNSWHYASYAAAIVMVFCVVKGGVLQKSIKEAAVQKASVLVVQNP